MSNVPTFISIYDNALSKDECNLMIDEFEISKHKWKAGLTAPSYEPDPENKISTEIFHELDDDTHTSNILVKKLRIHVEKYNEEYSDVNKLIAPLNFLFFILNLLTAATKQAIEAFMSLAPRPINLLFLIAGLKGLTLQSFKFPGGTTSV